MDMPWKHAMFPKSTLLVIVLVFLSHHTLSCDRAEAQETSLNYASGAEAGPEKIYGAISGYLEVFSRKQERPKHRVSDVKSRYQGQRNSAREEISKGIEIDWNLAQKRIERHEFDLAVYPLERALRKAHKAGDSERELTLQEILRRLQARTENNLDQPVPSGEAVNSIGLRLKAIKPGNFSMGSSDSELRRIQTEWNAPEDAIKQETPSHSVQITHPYLLGKYHVTVGQFRAFVEETGYRTLAERQDWGWVYDNDKKHWAKKTGASWKNPGFEVWPDQPVTMIAHSDAEAFCQWLTKKENRKYHLPTEAQWEYAARGGKEGERFPWGKDYPDGSLLNMADWRAPMPWGDRTVDDGYAKVSPIGSYEPNGFGLHDMVGNLWQFCYDYYDAKLYDQSKSSLLTDPAGPKSGKELVVRGGNWAFGAGIARNAFRAGVDPNIAADVCGFRVAAALSPQEYREHRTKSQSSLKTDDLMKLMDRMKTLAEKGKRSAARKLTEEFDSNEPKGGVSVEPSFFVKTLLGKLIDETGKKEKYTFENSVGMTMVRIPAGSFLMGSSDADVAWALNTLAPGQPVNLENETPLRKVRLSRPFLISATPVTIGQFRKFVEETGYITEAEEDGAGLAYSLDSLHFEPMKGLSWKNPGWPVTDDQPVTLVTYGDAQAFVDWLTAKEDLPYKLPTEAQWECAARGGLPAPRFPWGDDPPNGRKANYADKNKPFLWKDSNEDGGYPNVSPVGRFPANGFGLYDMSGNVLQWVRDYYSDGYYGYAPEIDPEGPAHGQFRVLKGGDWTSGPVRLRCAFRGRAWPDLALYNVGFRVAIELANPVREFHFASDFLTKTWVPGPEHRAVAETTAKHKELARTASGNRAHRTLSSGSSANPVSVKGAYILDFTTGSIARKAGLIRGDVIIEYNGVRDLTSDRILELSSLRTPKSVTPMIFVREGQEYTVALPPGDLGVSTTDIVVQAPLKKPDTTPRIERDGAEQGSSKRDWM
jgi:formylglycine-generating enzyme required for sulfatase activity